MSPLSPTRCPSHRTVWGVLRLCAHHLPHHRPLHAPPCALLCTPVCRPVCPIMPHIDPLLVVWWGSGVGVVWFSLPRRTRGSAQPDVAVLNQLHPRPSREASDAGTSRGRGEMPTSAGGTSQCSGLKRTTAHAVGCAVALGGEPSASRLAHAECVRPVRISQIMRRLTRDGIIGAVRCR